MIDELSIEALQDVVRKEIENYFHHHKQHQELDLIFHESKREIEYASGTRVEFGTQLILFYFFELLLKNHGQSLSKEKIVELLWKEKYDPTQHDNKLYVCIKRLRNLIEPDRNRPVFILRDREGYCLNPLLRILRK